MDEINRINMLENISNVEISGGYFDIPVRQNLLTGRVNVVFGRNGSGKSTISRALREYSKSGDELSEQKYSTVFDSPLDKDKVFVFNEDFLREKILVKEQGVDTIVMFGSQIEVDDKINKLKNLLGELLNKQKQQLEKLNEYKDKKNEKSPSYIFDNELKKSLSEWAQNESQLKGKNRKSTINKDTIDKLYSCLKSLENNDTIDSLLENFQNKKALYASTTDAIPLKWSYEKYSFPMGLNEVMQVLNAHLEPPQLSDRDKIIASIASGVYGKYVYDARNIFTSTSLKLCPLCQRSIGNEEKTELLKRIEAYFDDKAQKYQGELEKLQQDFANQNNLFFDDLMTHANFAINVQIIEGKWAKLNGCLASIRTLIDKKLADIYSHERYELPIHEMESILNDYNDSCSKLFGEIKVYNQAIRDRTILQEELLSLNDKLACLSNKELFEKYEEARAALEKCQDDLRQTSLSIKKIQADISELEAQKKQVVLALDFINHALAYIFFDKKRLFLEAGEGCYKLMSRGHSVNPRDVSVGERNIIGLCYFFASLFNNKEEKSKYNNEMLVLLDDPVSSFDKENRVGVLSFLNMELHKIISGNCNSKIVVLTHDLQVAIDVKGFCDSWFPNNECNKNVITSILKSKTLEEIKKLSKVSEYQELMKKIYDFANDDTETDDACYIGNAMRRVLEAYFTFNYSVGFSNVECLGRLLQGMPELNEHYKNLLMRLLLNGESHYQSRVKSMTLDIEMYSLDEKKRISKEILCLLCSLHEPHIVQMLSESALEKIKLWSNEIENL